MGIQQQTEDFRPITSDFLNHLPTSDLPVGDSSRALPRDYMQYVRRMSNLIWDHWNQFYLPTLVPRRKWTQGERNTAVGDGARVAKFNTDSG